MADSYPEADVGAVADFPRFGFKPNWASAPSTTLEFMRNLISERGASHGLASVTDDVPIQFEARYTLFTRAEFNTFLDFFVTARGMVNRFWVAHPQWTFKLKTAATNGDGVIYCEPNFFEQQYQGYERIYIEMADGDIVARYVTNVAYNETEDRVELTLNTILDRDIGLTDYVIIGRYLLARFDSDELDCTFETDTVCQLSTAFRELVKEYDEI